MVPEAEEVVPRAWLLLAVGDNRQHGGNDGYIDEPDVFYSWDSTVPNAARVRVGDSIAIWDKKRLLGISTIEEIDTWSEQKLLHRCSHCDKAHIKPRKTLTPRYKCFNCGVTFDVPHTSVETVTCYRSRHDGGWRRLEDVLSGSELRGLCYSPKSQLSIRPLRWPELLEQVAKRVGESVVREGQRRAPSVWGGHVLATVRVRLGQQAFRKRLLERTGAVCAFTGPAPSAVLEAGHLYSYADLGVHHDHGGLLLRRDIHRLFDDGSLAVNPETGVVDVSVALSAFPQYKALHGEFLQVELQESHRDWLQRHWDQHRPASSAPTSPFGR